MAIDTHLVRRFGALSTLALGALLGAGCATQHDLADGSDGYGDGVSAREYGYVRPSSDAWMFGEDRPKVLKRQSYQSSGDLWARVRGGMKLNRYASVRIDSKVNSFRQDPQYLAKLSDRARPYLHLVVAEIERRGLPSELALLPHVESRYNPAATSPKAAAGMWQFIPSTGRIMGLRQDSWYDGRRDVVASTRAAMDYLEQLHRRLGGDWELAMAAYNCGPGRVESAMAANRAKGLPTDFWSLNLPTETENYVPQILAAARLVAEPAKYGMRLPPVPTGPQLEVVKTDRAVDLARVAVASGVGLTELKRLNPAIKRGQTSPEGPAHLLVPAGTGNRVTQTLARAEVLPAPALPDRPAAPVARTERPSRDLGEGRAHLVKSGETLRTIARAAGVDPMELAELNALQPGEPLLPGQTLLVPGAERAEMLTHRVRKGDSLDTIARRYGVTVGDLRRWNPVATNALRSGAVIRIYRRGDQSA